MWLVCKTGKQQAIKATLNSNARISKLFLRSLDNKYFRLNGYVVFDVLLQ